jgi:hypothetical protein
MYFWLLFSAVIYVCMIFLVVKINESVKVILFQVITYKTKTYNLIYDLSAVYAGNKKRCLFDDEQKNLNKYSCTYYVCMICIFFFYVLCNILKK